MNRYEILVALGLVVFYTFPAVTVTYTVPDAYPPLHFIQGIQVWPIVDSSVLYTDVAILFSITWAILGLIQTFNIVHVTRGNYRQYIAWIILLITVVLEQILVTQLVIPFIQFQAGMYRSIEITNYLPIVVLNSGLIIYSISRRTEQSDKSGNIEIKQED